MIWIYRCYQFLRQRLTPVGGFSLCLSLWGCLAIYNATFHLTPAYYYVGRQLLWLLVGAGALLLCSGSNRRQLEQLLPWAGAAAYASLWLVLIYGIRINGMRGWFAWHGIFLQPSEIAKPVFVLCLSWLLYRLQPYRHDWRRGYLPPLALLLAWCVPLLLQPDFGIILVYAMTFAVMYWYVGGSLLHLGATAAVTLPPMLWLIRGTYVQARIIGFLDPEAHALNIGWHIRQFQRALASGGLFGRSWGDPIWSQNYLPLGYSDSIFATIAESIGFVGVLPFLILLAAWIYYGYRKTLVQDNMFVAATILGLTLMLAIQAFIHLSVNLSLMPPTGITLPLISYGGSSLVATLISVGLLECLARQR